MIDVSRRGFLFGATASLVIPPKKSFFIMQPPKLIPARLNDSEFLIRPQFDLPMKEMLALLKKLEDQVIETSAIPRWVVLNADEYEAITGERFAVSRVTPNA